MTTSSEYLDQSLVTEVQAWIAEDPDPETAAQLQKWLDEHNESELRQSFAGWSVKLRLGPPGLLSLLVSLL